MSGIGRLAGRVGPQAVVAGLVAAIVTSGAFLLLSAGNVRAPGVTPSGVAVTPSAASSAPSSAPSSPASSAPTSTPVPSPTVGQRFEAPRIAWPLPDADPGLRTRGLHPSLAQLSGYLFGDVPVVFLDRSARDWRLSKPDAVALSGYPTTVSVLAGDSLGLCVGGVATRARLEIFRVGRADAEAVASPVQITLTGRRFHTTIDGATFRVDADCPSLVNVALPRSWTSGLYLVKLTATGLSAPSPLSPRTVSQGIARIRRSAVPQATHLGGQAYVPFVVRPSAPPALLVVLPFMTYEAYNSWGGASLYHRSSSPQTRGYAVSFDRPFGYEAGAGLLYRTDFPLLVWLADHGYRAGYVTDADLAADPHQAAFAQTVILVGHGEYWTAGLRATVLAAEARGAGVVAFGANLAYWQVRLGKDRAGRANRVIVCYKDARLDPIARRQPQLATIRFEDLPHPEPAAQLFGEPYLGIVRAGVGSMTIGPGAASFAPWLGLRPGDQLRALIGDELDGPALRDGDHSLIGASTLFISTERHLVEADAALWIAPGGGHVFDAGTFTWSWGLDPRYAAALPGFPSDRFAYLTAEILAWAGAEPGSQAVGLNELARDRLRL